jgi:hypothetical protein
MNEKRIYLVGDRNGTFLSKEGNKTTNDLNEAKEFDKIGEAIKACIMYNINEHSFRVIPYYVKEKESNKE